MSADNWSVCPVCAEAAEAANAEERAEREAELAAAYGNVSPEEYAELLLVPEGDPVPFRPDFREDWEIGLVGHPATNREVFISYSGRCAYCGAGVKFQTSVLVERPS